MLFDDNACELVGKKYINKTLPLVFCGMNGEPENYGFPAENITGVVERHHLREFMCSDCLYLYHTIKEKCLKMTAEAHLVFSAMFSSKKAKYCAVETPTVPHSLFTICH